MKMIDKMLHCLEEEVEGAKDYAEKYIESKAKGNLNEANRYKEMSNDELKHAGYLREMYMLKIAAIKKVYALNEEEEEKWSHHHKILNEQMAIVKQMLTM